MKRVLITLFLLLSAASLKAYYPRVRNFTREVYGAGTQTWAITQIPGGSIFFANNDGVLQFNGSEWTLIRLANRSSARSLFYDQTRRCLFVGGTNELGRIDFTPEGLRYSSLLDSLGIYLNEIWSIGRDGDGALWFEDNTNRYTMGDGFLRQDSLSRDFTPRDKVFCEASNEDFRAEGTSGDGIYIYSKRDGGTIHLTKRTGLQNNSILCLYFDRLGGLWAGTDNGIDYILLNSPVFNLFGQNDTFGSGYAICRSGGWLYLGTNLGLFRVREEKMGLSLQDSDFEKVRGVDNQVWGLSVAGEDIIACCDRGVYVCRNGTLVNRIPTDGAWKAEPLQGHPDRLLCCSYTRFFLLRRQRDQWAFLCWVSGFDEAGKSFLQDDDGRIWFAHHVKGLYRLTLSEDCTRVVHTERLGFEQGFPTSKGNYPGVYHGMTVFSTEGGFYRYDDTSGSASPFNELNHRFGGTPNSVGVFESPLGNIRYYSSAAMQAIEYYDGNGAVMDSLSLRSLLGHRPVGFECAGCIGERDILLNSDNGFAVVNLDRTIKTSHTPADSVFISAVQTVDGSLLYSGISPSGARRQLTVPHSKNSLIFRFIQPAYDSTVPTEYSCMLKGRDKSFSEFSTDASRIYSRIPAGRYTFIVKARNPLHGNIVTLDSIDLSVERPWTGSFWAWAIYILGGSGLLLLLSMSFNRLASKRAAKLAEEEAQKMRQAQMQKDLHTKADDLAASIMRVQRKNELLQQISGRVDEALESAKRSDPLESQLRRLRGISELIRENITHENDWNKFQDNFDLVYDDFLKRLGAAYPNLSITDKRICAYLRMGLNSKDISPLLGMSVHSVEMTRYRIRQKIGLGRKDNLTSFLQKY